MHDALIAAAALLIGLAAGVAVTLRLTADRTGVVVSLSDAARRVTDYHEQVRGLVDLLPTVCRPPAAGSATPSAPPSYPTLGSPLGSDVDRGTATLTQGLPSVIVPRG